MRLLIMSMIAGLAVGCVTTRRPQPQESAPDRNQSGPVVTPRTTRAIEVVPKYAAVRALRYPDTLDELNPRKGFDAEKAVTAPEDLKNFAALLKAGEDYRPEYLKRCLPVYDYGLEFRTKSEQAGRLFLFSFRCATIKILEPGATSADAPGLFRDFTKDRMEYYKIFRRLLGPNVYMEDNPVQERGPRKKNNPPVQEKDESPELDIDDLDDLDRHFEKL